MCTYVGTFYVHKGIQAAPTANSLFYGEKEEIIKINCDPKYPDFICI